MERGCLAPFPKIQSDVVYECTNRFLLKTDDDSFIHLESLWDLAKSRMVKKSNHLIGFLQLGIKKHHYLPLGRFPMEIKTKIK